MQERDALINVLQFSWLTVISLGLASAPLAAGVSTRNLPAEGVTDDSVTMKAELTTGSAETVAIMAYCGTRDKGNRPDDWEFRIILGHRTSGVIEAPIAGLEPGTIYCYTFQARTPNSESWAPKPMTFSTKPAPSVRDSREWVKSLNRWEIPERGLISSKPASRWEEGLISGNGKMGALVMSRPRDERIILTHEKVWLPLHKPLPPVEQATLLPRIRQMIKEGRYQDAADLVVAQSVKENYGPKRWTDPFMPALDLLVHMDAKGELRNYLRSVDFSTGVATVRWEDERGVFRRRLFVSRADNLMVLSLTGPEKQKFNCTLELAQHPIDNSNASWQAQERFAYGIKQIEIGANRKWMTYRSSFMRTNGGYLAAAYVTVRKAASTSEGRKVVVRNAEEVLVVLRIEPSEDYAKADIRTLEQDVSRIKGDFQTLLNRHAKIHAQIFNRAKLDLNGGEDRFLPTEDLIAKSSVESPSMALLEKVFDAGRYTILSPSGDRPPNLQGKWTGTWGAPWSGDCTLNGNVQSAVASMLSGNMPECMESLFKYVEAFVPHMQENARRLYGCRGIHLPSRTSTHGFNNHFDETWPMTFWTAGAGWIARFFYDYYLYTGNRTFLVERALPFMKEAASFYEEFLIEDESGKYVFNPSYSPENNPGNSKSQAAINATMDIAVAKDLLTNLIDACESLKVDHAGVARWKRMLAKMPDYMVNADGAVKEWAWPTLEDNYTHRHSSHLFPLFFGVAPDIAQNPPILQAFRRAIELRVRERIRQGGGDMSFGLVQLGQAATSLADARTAYTILRWLANRYYYSNLVSSHDPGPAIFNVDICGGLPDLLIRMLVQSKPGQIELLPALPDQLASGEADGVLCRGQVLMKSLKWNQKQIHVVLNSKKDQTITLKLPGEIASVRTTAGRAEIKQTSHGSREIIKAGNISGTIIQHVTPCKSRRS